MRPSFPVTILVCLALAGCSKAPPPTIEQAHADWSAKVHAAISDPVRAERVSALARQIVDEQRSLAADLESTAERLAVLNADYEASNEEFMAAYGDYEARRKAALMRLRKRIFAIRKEVSAEEWKAIVK